jgi:hypothetical protein
MQEITIKIDKNMQASGKSNLPGFTRGNTSKQSDNKEKAVTSDNNDASHDPLKDLTEMMKRMESNHATQLSAMARHKGVTYQRRGNDNTNKSYQNIPKVISPPIADLSIDLGN